MTKPQDNPRRTLCHLKRLSREGGELLQNRPLDELAHAKWTMRTVRYLERKMPDIQVPPLYQLSELQMPDLLNRNRKRLHPLDAAIIRSERGQKLILRLLTILASASEKLELSVEAEGT